MSKIKPDSISIANDHPRLEPAQDPQIGDIRMWNGQKSVVIGVAATGSRTKSLTNRYLVQVDKDNFHITSARWVDAGDLMTIDEYKASL